MRHLLLAVLLALTACTARPPRPPTPRAAPIASAQFRTGMESLSARGFLGGNHLTTLNDGAEIFPAMLAAIRGAQRTINFETYVFRLGQVPREFAEALAERARAGVDVKVIIDAHGGNTSFPYHHLMNAAGVKLELYHTLYWLNPLRYNYRTHRKLLIVDGRIGFIGGVGISDKWKGRARNPQEWREVHYRVTGPIVAQLQDAFGEHWHYTHEAPLEGWGQYPRLPFTGASFAKCFYSSPPEGRTALEQMYHLAIASARKSILIENAYFIPDNKLVELLCAAAQRGVKVQVIVPGRNIDYSIVRRASMRRWPKLLEAGVELYEYQPTMLHSKIFIADGHFVTIGSANLDPRSMRINDEANLAVLDPTFAAKQTKLFEHDLRHSHRRTLNDHTWHRLINHPVSFFESAFDSQL